MDDMTVDQALEVESRLAQLASESWPVPVKVKLNRHRQRLGEALQPYHEARNDLIREVTENGVQIEPGTEEWVAFQIEWQETGGKELEVEMPDPVPVSRLQDGETEVDIAPLLEAGVLEDDL